MAKVSLRAYNQEIEGMIDRGHLDEAIAHCRHILKTFPKHLETYRLLGKAYLEYKRYPEAADVFSRVLASVPSDFVANVGMSIIRDEENKLDDAIWHMERAFETQPSNAAIQAEMQRLYGRREGVQPPRIRMTRGALAHMYVQGELYPQAIAEIKSVLKEDPGRSDMQVLLARAYYRGGLKNDAAEIASNVLNNYPYSLDPNRVMVEILSAEHPERVQAYRQRVVDLDPYAAQVTGSIFQSADVPDAAVALEHLDWNGQPVGQQPDWQAAQAMQSSAAQDEQPDWLKDAFGETSSAAQPQVPAFDAAVPPASASEPLDDIPDFLRQAGWGKSTGAFDESKSAFSESEPSGAEPSIEQGDLPDWVKAMAPQQPAETPAEEAELPDWINKIGTSALPAASAAAEQPDWLQGIDQTAQPQAKGETDWLNQMSAAEQPAAKAPADEPDWLKGFGNESESASLEPSTGELDWLTQLSQGEGSEVQPVERPSGDFDVLRQPMETASASSDELNVLSESGAQAPASSPSGSADEFDFLDPLGSQRRSVPSRDDFDFLNELTAETTQSAPPASSEPSAAGTLGMSEAEQDDSFAWLESLAAKQGATEGLLTRPEDRLDEEPEWVKQAKDMQTGETSVETPAAAEPAATMGEPGRSQQEQDDSFAWLEALAAKQGATEGLLTKPEERREEAPEWVQQAREFISEEETVFEQAAQEERPLAPEPSASLGDLGTTEQERDDSFAWLEALAAKQGASEGLLTRPEDRPQEEPEWIKQAKDLEESPIPEPESSSSLDNTAVWLRSLEQEDTRADAPKLSEAQAEQLSSTTAGFEQSAPKDEVEAWLQSLEGGEAAREPEPLESPTDWLGQVEQAVEETAPVSEEAAEPDTESWLKALDVPEGFAPKSAAPAPAEDLPVWMQDLAGEQSVEGSAPSSSDVSEPTAEQTDVPSLMDDQPEPAAPPAAKIDTGGLPSWLRGLEQEESDRTIFGAGSDLPAWLRDETREAAAEPTRVEPTRATDWQPIEAEPMQREPEPVTPEAADPRAPEPETSEPMMAPPRPEPVDVVAMIEQKIAASEPVPQKPEPTAEPATGPFRRKGTGTLTDLVLSQARTEFSRSNISGAVEHYSRLIKKGRLLDDIIDDLREALYRHPVDVDIWQSLGDAYMRTNRLQDALDAYTKAEELLR